MPYEDTSTVNRWWLLPRVEVVLRMRISADGGPNYGYPERGGSVIDVYFLDQKVKTLLESDQSFSFWKGFMRDQERVKIEMMPTKSKSDPAYDIVFSSGRGEARSIKEKDSEYEYFSNILGLITNQKVLNEDIW